MHDSVVESVEYLPGEKRLQIKLVLCQWKQAYYDEFEPEMQEGVPTLIDVGDSNEILEVKVYVENGNIQITLMGTGEVDKISIVAKDIFLGYCRMHIWTDYATPNGEYVAFLASNQVANIINPREIKEVKE